MTHRKATRAMGLGLVLLAAMWLAGGCFGGTLVQNPPPLTAASSTDATEQAILDALPRHGWSTEEVTPGRIVAFLSVKSVLLRCEITYDAQNVRIAYLDSDKLDAERNKRGEVYAHGKVNKWMRRLARDIQVGVSKAPVAAQ